MTRPDDLMEDEIGTYRDKEDDYGESWKLTGHQLWMMAGEEPIVLESPLEVIRFGLYYRRLDKLNGAFNGEINNDEEMNFEDAQNRHCDEGVYSFIHASTHGDEEGGEENGG